ERPAKSHHYDVDNPEFRPLFSSANRTAAKQDESSDCADYECDEVCANGIGEAVPFCRCGVRTDTNGPTHHNQHGKATPTKRNYQNNCYQYRQGTRCTAARERIVGIVDGDFDQFGSWQDKTF